MTTVRNVDLMYRDTPFAVYHLIDDCPPHTVVRELVKNAVEAATKLTPPGRIRWFTEHRDGVPKLGLYNEGPGMSADDLSRLMDLASTDKKLGIDHNYGQGGKISSLKASPHGVIYRSCHNGMVSEIELCAELRSGVDHPVYVKKRRLVEDEYGNEEWATVADVTHLTERDTNRDWTEVVLLGTSADHNTVAELLPGETGFTWLMRRINQRFYKFPDGIQIQECYLSPSDSKFGRNAEGLLGTTRRHSERHEAVYAEHEEFGPVSIHYFKLNGTTAENSAGRKSSMQRYGIGSRGDHIAMVWRDECYDVNTGWSRISGAFGVTYGSANVAIHIVLPDSAPVKNNTYRDQIIRRHGENQDVEVEDFAELVRDNRPQWLIDYIEEQASKNSDIADVSDRLKEYLKSLQCEAKPRAAGEAEENGESVDDVRRQRERNSNPKPPRPGPFPGPFPNRQVRGKRIPIQHSGPPRVRFCNPDEVAILEEMAGKAAVWKQEDNTVLLNPQFWRYQQYLENVYEETGPDAAARQMAKDIFDREYFYEAGCYVLQAWVFRGRPEWTDDDFVNALSSGSLTTNLVSTRTVDKARTEVRKRLRASKLEGRKSAKRDAD